MANKEINGSQCTAVFYVDNNKISSHQDLEVVMSVLEAISKHFGDLSMSRRMRHDF